MQLKSVKCSPAIRLIGHVSPEAMTRVIRYLDSLSAGVWRIAKVRLRTRNPYFVVRYKPTNRSGVWEAVFGLDGSCWAD